MGGGIQPVYESFFGTTPAATNHVPGGAFRIRTSFFATVAGRVIAARFYRDRSDLGNHMGFLVRRGPPGGRELLGAVAFGRQTSVGSSSGWQTKFFHPMIPVAANAWHDLVVEFTGGSYYANDGALSAADIVVGHLTAPKDTTVDPFGTAVNNSAIATTLNFNPTGSLAGQQAGIDLYFLPD